MSVGKKKRIDLRRAKPGMVLASPVLSENGRVIINEDVALTEAILQNLATLANPRRQHLG